MHGVQYYQCDWTAVPMRHSCCYMPTWSSAGKLTKHGSYCNWEAVLAHAHHKYETEKTLSLEEFEAVKAYIYNLTGHVPEYKSFHFSFLEHFKSSEPHWSALSGTEQNWSIDEFYDKCSRPTHRLIATVIPEDGAIYEVGLLPEDGTYDTDKAIKSVNSQFRSTDTPTGVFQTLRKSKTREREISVHYLPGIKQGVVPENVYNSTASQIFKMQLYGSVLIVQKCKELSNKPRERYIDFAKADFESMFSTKKRKRVANVTAVTKEEYAGMADTMKRKASEFEAKMTSGADTPGVVARAAVMPPSTGKELKVAAGKLAKLESRMTAALPSQATAVEVAA